MNNNILELTLSRSKPVKAPETAGTGGGATYHHLSLDYPKNLN